MDDGDGLFFMGHRHYDAATGRFLQRDPVGIHGGLNLYAYAANNPVNAIDPEGTFWVILGGIAILLGLGAAGLELGIGIQKAFNPNGSYSGGVWEAGMQRIEKRTTEALENVRQVAGSNPQAGVHRDIGSGMSALGDRAISIHPVFGTGYKGAKAVQQIGSGEIGEGIVTGVTAIPGKVGRTAGAVRNIGRIRRAIPQCPVPRK
jgi:hypothetical protein